MLTHYAKPQLDIINTARTALIDAFVQNDKEKVRELQQYLSANFDQSNYITLFPGEKILLSAWLGDYEKMELAIKESDSLYIENMQTKILPSSTNNFYRTAKEKIQQEQGIILADLQASSLLQEKKDFIAIYLRYYLITDANIDTMMRGINTDTRQFITDYPYSEYIGFFENYELRPSNWGYGLCANFGYAAKAGNLSKYFSNEGVLDCGIDVGYKKIMATIGVSCSFGDTQDDVPLPDGTVLDKGFSVSMYNLYLSIGYRFFDDKRVIVTPLAGIGTTSISYGSENDRKENSALKQLDYSYGLTANFGVMADIRIGKMKKMIGQNFTDPSFCAVRISYKFFYHTLGNVPTRYDGNLHTITVGLNFFLRQTKVVKYK
ncbi:MAG: hypothetical protein LBT48_01705 [Prevotellaceae bacterium]|nr:hypothetical protein [Prevotellaceae bacterium]